MLCLVGTGSAASTMFNETTSGLFDDIELGLKELVLSLVSIFAIYSVGAILVGWFGHKEKLFKSGVYGCGIIIFCAVMYFMGINGFEYVVDNYW